MLAHVMTLASKSQHLWRLASGLSLCWILLTADKKHSSEILDSISETENVPPNTLGHGVGKYDFVSLMPPAR